MPLLHSTFPHRLGLTRLDLVAISIVGISFLGLVLVFLPRQREHGQRTQCVNNLRRLGEGFQSYHKAHESLPPGRIADGYATWAVLLAPHVGRDLPLEQWLEPKSFVAQDDAVRQAAMAIFLCPSRERTTAHGIDGALGDYAAVAGNGDPQHPWNGPNANGPLIDAEVLQRQKDEVLKWRGRVKLANLQRGLSYTLLVGEKHVPPGGLGQPDQGDGSLYDGRQPVYFARAIGPGFGLASPTDPLNANFGSSHPGQSQFLRADGSVRSFANATSVDVLGRLATRD